MGNIGFWVPFARLLYIKGFLELIRLVHHYGTPPASPVPAVPSTKRRPAAPCSALLVQASQGTPPWSTPHHTAAQAQRGAKAGSPRKTVIGELQAYGVAFLRHPTAAGCAT